MCDWKFVLYCWSQHPSGWITKEETWLVKHVGEDTPFPMIGWSAWRRESEAPRAQRKSNLHLVWGSPREGNLVNLICQRKGQGHTLWHCDIMHMCTCIMSLCMAGLCYFMIVISLLLIHVGGNILILLWPWSCLWCNTHIWPSTKSWNENLWNVDISNYVLLKLGMKHLSHIYM